MQSIKIGLLPKLLAWYLQFTFFNCKIWGPEHCFSVSEILTTSLYQMIVRQNTTSCISKYESNQSEHLEGPYTFLNSYVFVFKWVLNGIFLPCWFGLAKLQYIFSLTPLNLRWNTFSVKGITLYILMQHSLFNYLFSVIDISVLNFNFSSNWSVDFIRNTK